MASTTNPQRRRLVERPEPLIRVHRSLICPLLHRAVAVPSGMSPFGEHGGALGRSSSFFLRARNQKSEQMGWANHTSFQVARSSGTGSNATGSRFRAVRQRLSPGD